MTVATPNLWDQDPRTTIEQRHQQLLRTTQAMWTLMKERLDFSDAELTRLVTVGSMNHELGFHPAEAIASRLTRCVLCQRPMRNDAKRCLYCGTAPNHALHSQSLTQNRFPSQ